MTVDDVLVRIEACKSLHELESKEFAEEGRFADILASGFGDDLKATQLRKVFGALKQIDLKLKAVAPDTSLDRGGINRLIPELAYALGRKHIPEKFYRLMKMCLGQDRLKTVGDLRRLMEFLTAILAYHKFHSSKREPRRLS